MNQRPVKPFKGTIYSDTPETYRARQVAEGLAHAVDVQHQMKLRDSQRINEAAKLLQESGHSLLADTIMRLDPGPQRRVALQQQLRQWQALSAPLEKIAAEMHASGFTLNFDLDDHEARAFALQQQLRQWQPGDEGVQRSVILQHLRTAFVRGMRYQLEVLRLVPSALPELSSGGADLPPTRKRPPARRRARR